MRECSGLDNDCIGSSDVVDVLISYDVRNKKHSFPLIWHISISGPIDLIILPKLVSLLPKFFFYEDFENNEGFKYHNHCSIAPFGCDIDAKVAALAKKPYRGSSSIPLEGFTLIKFLS